MPFDSVGTLRAAGILGGALSPEHEEYYRSLSEQETSLLVSLKDRLPGFLPEVQGHSADWTKPEALQLDANAELSCACGAWSGSGSGGSGN